jgi:hypothetical protein
MTSVQVWQGAGQRLRLAFTQQIEDRGMSLGNTFSLPGIDNCFPALIHLKRRNTMKTAFLVGVSTLLVSFAAHAAKPCEDLKDEITKKVEAKGVQGFTLEVVAAADVGSKKVVGSCEAGSKKIVYEKK